MSQTKQVGGTHYETVTGEQHWDLMEEFDISYLEAVASKYVMRYDRKGTPALDLAKGQSYLQRLMESRTEVRRTIPQHRLETFYHANDLSEDKQALLNLIHNLGTVEAIMMAIDKLGQMAKSYK